MICPITGEVCLNEKKVHVTEIEKGQVVYTADLCHVCGDEIRKATLPKNMQGDITPAGGNHMPIITTATELLDLLTGKTTKPQPVIESTKNPCPRCGLTIDEFNLSGKFGCPTCYEHYRDEFIAVSINRQADCHHVGKSPKSAIKKAAEKVEQLKVLKLRLAKAKELEQFDKVAELKQQIKDLTKEGE
jgi:protein arginine kinase activator